MKLSNPAGEKFAMLLVAVAFCLSIIFFPSQAGAQTEDAEKLRTQAAQFLQQNNYLAALPVLEKLVAIEPDNANIQFFFGFCLVTKAIDTQDAAAQKQLRARARAALVKARELGRNDAIVNSLIDTIAPDGSENAAPADKVEKPKYSDNAEANSLMQQGEAAFYRGKGEEALRLYQKALELDPKLYRAALYSGDVYGQMKDYANAEIWYQKAITINPDIETGYRYSATPLMKQGKYDEARERYIEAFITDPFSRLAAGGLEQWAQVTEKSLGHPKIEIPASVGKSADGNTSITLGIGGSGDKDLEDGSFAWTAYAMHKALWQTGKDGKLSDYFKKAYPSETAYRSSLAEELAAMKMTVTVLKARMKDKDSKVKTLNPSLARLVELHDKDLLEPYILLARMDRGIAEDYRPYLKNNRAKLRQYVREYVIH